MFIDHNANLPVHFVHQADQIEASLNGEPLNIRRYSQFDEPVYFIHASLTSDEEYTFWFAIKRKHHYLTTHSLSTPMQFDADRYGNGKGKYTTTIRGNSYHVLECDGIGYVCICFDPLQEEPTGDGVINFADLGIEPSMEKVQTEAIQAALDRVSEDDSLHTLVAPAGIYRFGDLHIPSNCRLHLCSGAALKASDNADDIGDASLPGAHRQRVCPIESRNTKNIAITGHGHIDGNRYVLDMKRYYKGLVRLTECDGITIDGPIFSDSAGWNTTPRHSSNMKVNRLKIINNRPTHACINTDGLNPDGCQHVTIEHCLFHTGDDAVAVKSTNYDGNATDCCDITVRDLLAINNSATAKIGTETMAEKMERIHFSNIQAVRTARLVALDAFDHAAIKDVSWTNCHAHELDGSWIEALLAEIRTPNPGEGHRPLPGKATVDNIALTNISSAEPSKSVIRHRTTDAELAITNLTVTNLTSAGQAVELLDESEQDHRLAGTP